MELVNTSPIPALVELASAAPKNTRQGLAVAKASFSYDRWGRLQLDTQTPEALMLGDRPTPVGVIPADVRARETPGFEVIVIGSAHALHGHPTGKMKVTLRVGNREQSLLVFGDRHWIGPPMRATISPPQPFVRMPLTYERAFGGTCAVELDADTTIDIADPINPHGRGFEPSEQALPLAKHLRAPKGYPVLPPERLLPNLEDPNERIRCWTDRPLPACWSARPIDMGFNLAAHLVPDSRIGKMMARHPDPIDALLIRAHPDWLIDLPPPEAEVVLGGLDPAGVVHLRLPRLKVVLDMVAGDEQSTLCLIPQALILYPDDRRLQLLYRRTFSAPAPNGTPRCARLRVEDGWPAASEAMQ